MGDQRDRTGRDRVPLEVPDRAHPAGRVHEAHAAAAADLEPVGGRDHLLAQSVRRPVDDGPAVTASRRDPHLLDKGVVGYAD